MPNVLITSILKEVVVSTVVDVKVERDSTVATGLVLPDKSGGGCRGSIGDIMPGVVVASCLSVDNSIAVFDGE